MQIHFSSDECLPNLRRDFNKRSYQICVLPWRSIGHNIGQRPACTQRENRTPIPIGCSSTMLKNRRESLIKHKLQAVVITDKCRQRQQILCPRDRDANANSLDHQTNQLSLIRGEYLQVSGMKQRLFVICDHATVYVQKLVYVLMKPRWHFVPV